MIAVAELESGVEEGGSVGPVAGGGGRPGDLERPWTEHVRAVGAETHVQARPGTVLVEGQLRERNIYSASHKKINLQFTNLILNKAVLTQVKEDFYGAPKIKHIYTISFKNVRTTIL